MVNSIELQMVCKIITSTNQLEVDRLCAYDSSYYSVLNEQIEFILDHRDKTGKVPDKFTFQAQFPDLTIIEVNEPLEYLETEIKKNKQRIVFLDTYNKLADLGSDDVTEAWDFLYKQCELAQDLSTSKPMDIVEDADIRAEKIIEYNKQQRIPTGFKEIDEIMYGGLSTVEEFLLIVARTNAGKAQPLWSKVLTTSGWVKMGDIKLGDHVIGQNNDVGEVVGIYPQGRMGYYKITFDDNSEVECCDNHLWNVLSAERRQPSNAHYNEVETLEFKYIREHLENDYSIDLSSPVVFEDSEFDKDSELDGYLLGVILGDGGLRDDCVKITNESSEIWDRLETALSSYNCKRSGKHSDYISGIAYGKNFVREKIIEYGLMGKESIDKFIPSQYLTSPVEVRVNLLAGLLDTDGYMPKNHGTSWEFDTASGELANGFVELAQSLGCFVKLHLRKDSSYTEDGKRIEANGIYHIVGRSSFNPFWFSGKANRYDEQIQSLTRGQKRLCKKIKSVEYISETECQCIMLNNNSHTYLTDGYTVTHNTWVMVKLMESAQANGFPTLYYSPEMQDSFIGTRFDTWRGHFKNSDLYRGAYSEQYKKYIEDLKNAETPAYVIEDKDMSEGKTTVRALEDLVKRYHIKLLIIDGLSYIASTTKYSNESIRYRDICNDLFKLSKKYGCAVVAAVQANRESRENRDENGDVFPSIYNISESDHPARIATQVFAMRQLWEKHILQFRLEKSRNAKNEQPVISYSVDFNIGTVQYIPDDDNDFSTIGEEEFSTPVVTLHEENSSNNFDDLPDYNSTDDDDDDDIEF